MDNLTARALCEEMAYIKGYTEAVEETMHKRQKERERKKRRQEQRIKRIVKVIYAAAGLAAGITVALVDSGDCTFLLWIIALEAVAAREAYMKAKRGKKHGNDRKNNKR